MNDHWTDEELATLLGDTFASREALADPETAHEVAASAVSVGPPGRRRWPTYVAAVASVVVVAGVGAYAVTNRGSETPVATPSHSPSTATDSPSPPTTAPPERTYAENRAAAAAESARIVELAPLPAGAERLDGQPAGWPEGGMSLGPSDGSLTRTAWWSVAAGADALETFLLSHDPPDMGMQDGDGVGGGSDGMRYVTYEQKQPVDPDAFTGTSLLVQWLEVDGRSLVRVDTFLAARDVRTPETYIDETVTAVDIERVESGMERGGGGTLPAVHLTEPDDGARIEHLVDAANGLRASIKPAFFSSCPFPGDPPPSVTVTFHTTTGDIKMHLELSCWGQVTVRRDGRLLSPTLDPDSFNEAVEAAANN